ncbi:MAG: DUF3575 domain-containing protein [Muribaculaceae bacterium]|nr:DUF3575 domain-containing protein [Muribaculaceae bacterium]
MYFKRLTAILALLFLLVIPAGAQKFGIKSNLISDAVTTPNLGIEFRMAPKWTMDISGQLNAWNIHERRWRHWMVQPEARWWICEAFQGNFLALHALGGQYNVGNINTNVKFLGSDFSGLKDHRYQGWAIGAGIGWGHDWILAKHWNIELEIGIGWIYTRFNRYPCTVCGSIPDEDRNLHHNYFGPTKFSLAIEYIF